MALHLVTAATIDPVTAAEAKLHARVDHSTDDTLITDLITAATKWVQAYTRRQLIQATYDWKLSAFPDSPFYLPLAPLSSITSIKYVDTVGVEQTWGAANYIVDAPADDRADSGRVALAYSVTYPSIRDQMNAVTIRFVAGYGSTAASVPAMLRNAIKILVGEMYRHRIMTAEHITYETQLTLQRALSPYRAFAPTALAVD